MILNSTFTGSSLNNFLWAIMECHTLQWFYILSSESYTQQRDTGTISWYFEELVYILWNQIEETYAHILWNKIVIFLNDSYASSFLFYNE